MDRQWKDWTEPLELLLAEVKRFMDDVKAISSLTDMPIGGRRVDPPELYTRKEPLAKALNAFMTWKERKMIWTTEFLGDYVYVSSVYEDAYSFAFEYIGENEHQFDLHGDEFAQTKEALLEDFALYVENWQSPYWRNLE